MSRRQQPLKRILKGFPIMMTRALLVAGGLLMASIGSALADGFTATVIDWDTTTRTITFHDLSKLADIPPTVSVPAGLSIGDSVTVEYEGSENGIEAINSITINSDIAKRMVPQAGKRG
jgi:hypothetical protein